MNNFFKIVFLVFVSVLAINCTTDDEPVTEFVPENFEIQYKKDQDSIIKFLKTHSITLDTDFNVTAYPIVAELDPTSIWGTNPTTHNATVLERKLYVSGVEYTIYYLKLNQGGGDRPCSVDQIKVTYSGRVVKDIAASGTTPKTAPTPFDYSNNLQNPFSLQAGFTNSVISGWSEIIPQFNGATSTVSTNGNIVYSNPGAGVMFLPSGFAYFYNSPNDNVPAYAPLIFSFKLYGVTRTDSDADGVLSINEDLDGDFYVNEKGSDDKYLDDTDGDQIPNFIDKDDDNDSFLTYYEIKRPNWVYTNGVSVANGSYPFNGASIDNPLTAEIDETQGIPDCSGNFTNPTRIRKHLDKNCH